MCVCVYVYTLFMHLAPAVLKSTFAQGEEVRLRASWIPTFWLQPLQILSSLINQGTHQIRTLWEDILYHKMQEVACVSLYIGIIYYILVVNNDAAV